MGAFAYEIGSTVHIAPTELLIERNIRSAVPDAGLVKSIKAQGVLVPIVAVRNGEGHLVVRYGHRRTLASIEAGLATVPVYVQGEDSEDKAAEVTRIVTQRDENTQRSGLSQSDELAAVAQLTLLGLSANQIATKARINRKQVDAALAVNASQKAQDSMAERQLTIEQAAILAEFQDDEDALDRLTRCHVSQLEHTAQRIRDQRAEALALAQAAADYEAAGLRIIPKPGWNEKNTRTLGNLKDEDGQTLTTEGHLECPGHAAFLDTDWIYVDAEGNEVPEEAAWAAEDDEDSEVTYDQEQVYVPTYVCENYASHGHTYRWGNENGQGTAAGEPDETQKAEAKAQRKLVIDNNKAWDSATTVRQTWLKKFASGKTPPKNAGRFLATALSLDYHVFTGNSGNNAHALAVEWLGAKKSSGYSHVDLAPAKNATDARAVMVSLVQVLAHYESTLSRLTWRSDNTATASGRYLRFIEACGYELSEVEKFAATNQTA